MAKDFLDKTGNILQVQNDQLNKVQNNIGQIKDGFESLDYMHKKHSDELDDLIAQAERLCNSKGIAPSDNNCVNDFSEIDDILNSINTDENCEKIASPVIENIETVDLGKDWNDYFSNIENYSYCHNIDFNLNPYDELLTTADKNEIARRLQEDYKLNYNGKIDKWDAIFAALSGVLTGLIDVFFVGIPGDSKLGKITDKAADKIVEKFTKIIYKSDRKQILTLKQKGIITKDTDYAPTGIPLPKKEPNGIASSIGYLEKRFKVVYDVRFAADLKNAPEGMVFSLKNHHLVSLGHAMDVFGLFFSILDQFTGSVSMFYNGKIVRLEPVKDGTYLQGNTTIEKILFGFLNWLGHLMSDLAGSSGTRGHEGRRGAGLVAPFFEFFQCCTKEIKLKSSKSKKDDFTSLAEITKEMYSKYKFDARFVAAQSIPVILNDFFIRIFWSMKQHFYHAKEWNECIPIKLSNKPSLQNMLLIGHGTLCLVDGVDAVAESNKDIMNILLRMNIVAWTKLSNLAFQKIRYLYNKDALNIEELDFDLENEWNALVIETEIA